MTRSGCLLAAGFLVLSSCSGVRTVDLVAEGQPRGYAEFYIPQPGVFFPTPGAEEDRARPEDWLLASTFFLLYKIEDGERKGLGMFPDLVSYSRLRVGVPPGSHTFAVEFASDDFKGRREKRIALTIQEGKLIPVRVRIHDTERRTVFENGRNVHRTRFKWDLVARDPLPITE